MLFNSFPFLFGFLPVCLGLYFLLARLASARAANVFLALASLGFYGFWSYEQPGGGQARRLLSYLLLLCATTGANYLVGYFLQRRPRRWLLAGGIGANLALLGWFKYSAFAAQSLNGLLGLSLPIPTLTLPLAISFYTFTQIAFLVDAFRGLTIELSFTRYGLFVVFFPHLIAGPIVHHSELMPQFAHPDAKRWNPANVSEGLCWLSLGLFKKVAFADSFAPLANAAFASSTHLTFLEAWAGALAYAFQLYFDFSGYSDMAIGVSLFFNVRLPDNFHAPYKARDIVDFWRRWHMTLSRFLRDYLYIPLGGNRRGPRRRHLNLFLTMLLGGIWHGAGWTYLLWGAYHGLLLIGCHSWQSLRHPLPGGVARSLTFLAVLVGWAIFRSGNLAQAGDVLAAMANFSSLRLDSLGSGLQLEHLAALAAGLGFVNMAPTTKDWIQTRSLEPRHAIALAALFCVALLLVRNVELHFARSEFIYFQF